MNLQEELKAMKERIAELEVLAKEEQKFPKVGDEYWYISSNGYILNAYNDGITGADVGLREIGNMFKTEEQAEFVVEKLKVEAELRNLSKTFEEGEINHYIFLDTANDCLDVAHLSYSQSQGTIHFESEEKAQQAIEAVGEERIKKYLFGLED